MKTEMTLVFALALGLKLRATLSPGCERIEIAGSIRRRGSRIGDIEMVAIAKIGPIPGNDLFDEPESLLIHILEDLVKKEKLRLVRGGEKLRCYTILTTEPYPQVDLFIVQPDSWGMQYAIRTGPWQYSKWLVTKREHGGGLDNDYWIANGTVWQRKPMDTPVTEQPSCVHGNERYEAYPVPEEEHFFALIAGGWVPPEKRAAPAKD